MACSRSMPPASSSSSMLSRLCESEPCSETAGFSSRRSMTGVRHFAVRASAQRRLPSIVLISPLCARIRNGCASAQRGAVFVEKRWWNTATLEAKSLRARSG